MAQGRDAELREKYVRGVKMEVAIARVRADVAASHGLLVREGLALPRGGSVSARVPRSELFVITPAGVPFADVAPENLVLCGIDGTAIAGTPGSERTPGAAAAWHAHVYANLPAAGSVVHTLSPYASAWAARDEQVPCVLEVMAEVFGGPIPSARRDADDDESIGRAVVAALTDARSPAVLVPQAGPVVVSQNVRDAASLSSLVEGVARIVQLAQDGGLPAPIAQRSIDRLYDRSSQVRPRRRSNPKVAAAAHD